MNDKNGRPFIHVVSKDIYLFTSRSNYLPHREIAISRRPDEAGGPASAGAGIGQGGKCLLDTWPFSSLLMPLFDCQDTVGGEAR